MKFKKPEDSFNQESGESLYLKIKDGQNLMFTPRGEIYEFYSVFGVKGPVLPSTPGARVRYKMNVVMSDDGGKTFKVKIYEFGKGIYKQLYEISEVCEVTTTKLRLSRRGASKEDTEYTLLPMIKEPLSAAMIQAIGQVELHILDKSIVGPLSPPGPGQDEEWPGF